MSHFNIARKGDSASAAEETFSENLNADTSRQGIVSTRLQHIDQLSLNRTSSEDNCENLQGNFVNFPTDHAYRKTTYSCGSRAAKANADGFPERNKAKLITSKLRQKIFPRDL